MEVDLKPETIKVLLAGRDAVDKFEADYDPNNDNASLELKESLVKLGFTDLQDFGVWNMQMIMLALKECRPREGSCDQCKGIPDNECPCVLTWGKRGAGGVPTDLKNIQYVRTIVSKYMNRKQTTNAELVEKAGIQAFVHNKPEWNNRVSLFCPVGHGFYYDITKIKEFPFDLSWLKPSMHLREDQAV